MQLPLFSLSPKNYLAVPLLSDTETQFEGENVKKNEKLYDSMPRPLEVITLKDLIHNFLKEFSPNAVNHLDDVAPRAEELYSEIMPMVNKRSTTTNTIQRRDIKNHWRISPLNYLMTSRILRINK